VDHYTGLLYRALNPIYASDPVSGRGPELYGGRFNPKGMPALYASLSPITALREANQIGALQPTTLVAYDADIRPIFDTRRAGALSAFGMTHDDLAAASWRDEMIARSESSTQKFRATTRRRSLCGAPRPLLRPRRLAQRSQSRAVALEPRSADKTRCHRRRRPSFQRCRPERPRLMVPAAHDNRKFGPISPRAADSIGRVLLQRAAMRWRIWERATDGSAEPRRWPGEAPALPGDLPCCRQPLLETFPILRAEVRQALGMPVSEQNKDAPGLATRGEMHYGALKFMK
jgi:RES domain-containing protein